MKKTKKILANTVIGGVLVMQGSISSAQGTSQTENNKAENVIPFRVQIPNSELEDLKKRIQSTRWPDRETVADNSQGVQLAKIQSLVKYWGTANHWRKG
jgi:hypothetical protein